MTSTTHRASFRPTQNQGAIGGRQAFIQGGASWALLLLCANLSVKADTWAMPERAEYWSANQRFVLEVLPKDVGCRAVLAEKAPTGGLVTLCQVTLTNEVSPVSALVSDDGQYFVTLDEWHDVGYGDAVLAFYNREGLLRHYSLEEIVGTTGELEWRDLFPHSVSSRWWRNHCLMFFGEGSQAGRFGIWLDWAPRWLIWNLAEGRPVGAADVAVADWDERGSAWARSRFAGASSIDERITACRYVAYSRRPEDRVVLVQALADGSQDLNHRQLVRLNADRALAVWDGVAQDFSGLEGHDELPERYYRLGMIDVSVRLPASATEGQVYLMLFPATVAASDWRDAPAEFRGGRSFRSPYRKSEPKNPIEFRINPARPGRYWVKAVWDRTPPFRYDLWSLDGFQAWLASTNNAVAVEPGDAESGAPEVFTVKVNEGVSVGLECRTID